MFVVLDVWMIKLTKTPIFPNCQVQIFCFLYTLESGINIAPWINVAPRKFGKKNKRSPIYTLYY